MEGEGGDYVEEVGGNLVEEDGVGKISGIMEVALEVDGDCDDGNGK